MILLRNSGRVLEGMGHIGKNLFDKSRATNGYYINNTTGAVRIGNRVGATDYTFDGYISLPKIYSKVLTQTEIARIYNSERKFFGV